MKVDPRVISAYQNSVNLTERASRVNGAAPVSGGQKGTAPKKSDEDARVTISPEARQLAAANAPEGASASESGNASMDQAKIAALKEKIQNGSLNVDSQVVAQRMIDRTG